ncbi:prolyl oligopeptidase [Xylariales sp. AK1849]|nr:prolyl oligopeptidase [Xylariales sp. AK1849]
MVVVQKFTPELLISSPRRGPAVPNHDGKLALFSQSTHEIGGKTLKEFRVLNIETGESAQLIEDEKARDVNWLGDGTNTVIYLSPGGTGFTWIMMADADSTSETPYILEVIQAPVSNLKVKRLKNGTIALVVVGLVDEKGELYNEESDKKAHTARVYDSYRPRIWDSYTKPHRHAIWYSTLAKEDGKWKLDKPLKNAVESTVLEAPANMYELSVPTDQIDISERGIAFTAEEYGVEDPMKIQISNVYYLPLDSFSEVSTQGLKRISVQTNSDEGYCSRPRFSPDGSMLAFQKAPRKQPAAISIYVNHLDTPSAIDVFTMVTGKKWNLVPEGFDFASNGHSLYITAFDCGRLGLYKLDLQPNAYPTTIFRSGSVSAYYPLQQDKDGINKLLVTSSSLVEPWIYQIIDGELGVESEPWIVSKGSEVTKLGLSSKQISEIYFEGAGDYCVHAWVIKPRDFDPSKKYPLCLHVHGGPTGSWGDAWSTRWNQAVWAEQGYIVVAPNVTGSQGFGLDYTEGVQDSWGDRPYNDLLNCVEYVKDMPGIDMENAVAAGASYGGYMMNWIQGHELGRRFNALVCHDGIFHLPSFVLQTDWAGADEEFGGPPFLWSNFDGLERYNPARPDLLKNWKTPMLVIHSDKDYRCPITDGLAAFHTLKALGTPARFLNFPDENHFVLKEENSLEWHRQVFAWINKWSGITAKNDGSSD